MPAKSTQRKTTASKAARPVVKKAAARKPAPARKLKGASEPEAAVPVVKNLTINPGRKAKVVSSELRYEVPLFRIYREQVKEQGRMLSRDIIRHNGSVVILALDRTKSKKDPWIVVERQYRHAANQFLWELPAGKLDPGEDPLAGAQRELEEETGYRAKKWKPLVEYFASPGFLGESMKVFLAEGLIPGDAHPEEDEAIELRLVKLSDALKMIEQGAILDGKTLTSVLLYTRMLAKKRKK